MPNLTPCLSIRTLRSMPSGRPVSNRIHVESVTARNVADAVALLERFFREEAFPSPAGGLEHRVRQYLEMAGHAVFLAFMDARPVGVATVATTFGLEYGWLAEMEDLYVVPEERGAGIGRILVQRAVRWSAERGCSAMVVTITPEGQASHDLIGFYAHLGFLDRGRRLLELRLDGREV